MREEEMELERMVQEVDNWWDDYMECVDDSGDTIMIDMTMETFFTNLYVILWTDLAYSFMDCEDVNGDVIMMYVGAGADSEILSRAVMIRFQGKASKCN